MTEPKPFVITIVGTESSGKTTLAIALAEHYQCPWVPEYAREYLMALDRPYNAEDLQIIAERQLEIILAAVNRESSIVNRELSGVSGELSVGSSISTLVLGPRSLVIIDGGMLNLKMWSRIKYGKTIPIVDEALKKDVTDLYLLCRPHKEWTADPLREAPSLLERAWIYNQYLEEIAKGGFKVEILGQEKNEILEYGIKMIEELIF